MPRKQKPQPILPPRPEDTDLVTRGKACINQSFTAMQRAHFRLHQSLWLGDPVRNFADYGPEGASAYDLYLELYRVISDTRPGACKYTPPPHVATRSPEGHVEITLT